MSFITANHPDIACVARSRRALASRARLALASRARVARSPGVLKLLHATPCTTANDCQFNGDCVNQTCRCYMLLIQGPVCPFAHVVLCCAVFHLPVSTWLSFCCAVFHLPAGHLVKNIHQCQVTALGSLGSLLQPI